MNLHTFLHCNSGPVKSSLFTPEEDKCLTTILEKRIKVTDFSSPNSSPTKSAPNLPLEIPSTLRPYYRTMAKARTPFQGSGGGTRVSPKKQSKRGWNLFELLKCRRCCCTSYSTRSRRQSHKNSSQASSPANSNPSSPFRCSSSSRSQQRQRTPEQPKKWNIAVEKCIVFLACLFD